MNTILAAILFAIIFILQLIGVYIMFRISLYALKQLWYDTPVHGRCSKCNMPKHPVLGAMCKDPDCPGVKKHAHK